MTNAISDPRFSQVVPTLQTRVNSSSLGPFKICPRLYWYKIICGWEATRKSVHLTFGSLVHKGIELFDLGQLEGVGFEANVEAVVQTMLTATWDFKLNRPWQSGDGNKNRESLIRTLVWYFDQYGQNDSMQTVRLANGLPAVELSFEFDSGYFSTLSNEPISFIGKLDKIVTFNDEFYVKDVKTSAHEVGPRFFSQFTPDNQFSLYSIAAKTVFDFDVRGMICDGIQVGAGFSRFYRAPIVRTEDILDEWLEDSHWWLGQMERCVETASWPMNDKACGLYGGCEFRPVCGARIGQRDGMLKAGWRRRKETTMQDVLEEDFI